MKIKSLNNLMKFACTGFDRLIIVRKTEIIYLAIVNILYFVVCVYINIKKFTVRVSQ